jgi:hypothetical protein
MERVIVLTAFFCIFFIRDVQLVSTAAGPSITIRLKLYAFCSISYAIVLILLLPVAGGQPSPNLFRSAPMGTAGILWHGIIWLSCLWLKRRNGTYQWWLIALLPAPVFLASVATLVFLVHGALGTAGSVRITAAIMGCWCAAISLAVAWVQREPPGVLESRFAVDFAGLANATALALLPLSGMLANPVG